MTVDQGYADEGEAEEKERKTWEWLVDGDAKAAAEPAKQGFEKEDS